MALGNVGVLRLAALAAAAWRPWWMPAAVREANATEYLEGNGNTSKEGRAPVCRKRQLADPRQRPPEE